MSDPMRLTVVGVGTCGRGPAVTVDDDGVEYPIPVTREQAKIAAPHLYETVRVALHFDGDPEPQRVEALLAAARKVAMYRHQMQVCTDETYAAARDGLCLASDELSEALQALDMAEIIGKEGK